MQYVCCSRRFTYPTPYNRDPSELSAPPTARSSPPLHASSTSSRPRSRPLPRDNRLPPTLPSTTVGTPSSEHRRWSCLSRSSGRETTMRDSVSPKRAASHRPDKSNELTNPMFPAMQHSARTTARPPSEQSWAECSMPSATARRQTRCTAASRSKLMLGRPATLSWTISRYSLPARDAASPRTSSEPSRTTISPSFLKAMVAWAETSSSRPSAPMMGVG